MQALAFGLSKDEALKAVTLYPAQILGIESRWAALPKERSPTILLTDGDPLETRTKIRQVFIAGKPVELKNKQTELYEIFSNRR